MVEGKGFDPWNISLELKNGYQGIIDSGKEIGGYRLGGSVGYFIPTKEADYFLDIQGIKLSAEGLTNPLKSNNFQSGLFCDYKDHFWVVSTGIGAGVELRDNREHSDEPSDISVGGVCRLSAGFAYDLISTELRVSAHPSAENKGMWGVYLNVDPLKLFLLNDLL